MAYVLLGIAILAEIIATSALKATEGFTRLIPSIIVVVGYVSAAYCLSLVLKVIPVGVAYAIWSGAGIALITLVAWVVYNQVLDLAAIIGIAFIVIGVLIINLYSNSVPHSL